MAAEDRAPEFIVILVVFLTLAWVFALTRFYVRYFMSRKMGWDDFALFLSIAFFSIYCSTAFMGVKYGTGKHIWNIPPDRLPKALYWWWLCEFFYNFATVSLRWSVGILLRRLCRNRVQVWVIYGALASVSIFSVFYFFMVMFQCTPPSFFWQQFEGRTDGWCHPATVISDASIAHSAVLGATDFALGFVPIFMVKPLQMNRKAKISVACILCLGMFAGITAFVRIPYTHTMATTGDFLYVTTDVAIWSTIEPSIGIVAASLAAMRPLLKSIYIKTVWGSRNDTTASTKTEAKTRQIVQNSIDREETELQSSGGNSQEEVRSPYANKPPGKVWFKSSERLTVHSDEEDASIEEAKDGGSRNGNFSAVNSTDGLPPPSWGP